MKKTNSWMVVLVLALILIVAGAGYGYSHLVKNNKAVEQTAQKSDTIPAPDFEVKDENGKTVHLSDFKGKPVVLNFWASWCTYCVKEMPDFDKAYQSQKDDVHFVLVNMTDGQRETVEKAKAFLGEQNLSLTSYYDTVDQQVARTYQVSSLPTTYFINAKGEIVGRQIGLTDAATLQKGIRLASES